MASAWLANHLARAPSLPAAVHHVVPGRGAACSLCSSDVIIDPTMPSSTSSSSSTRIAGAPDPIEIERLCVLLGHDNAVVQCDSLLSALEHSPRTPSAWDTAVQVGSDVFFFFFDFVFDFVFIYS
jgi:hypothetical protein